MLRLVSWNVAGRVKKLNAQVGALMEYEPHVIALQEVTAKTLLLWRQDLERRGYWVTASLDLSREHDVLKGGRKYGVLLTSRWSMESLPPTDFEVPWRERILSVAVDSPWGTIECHNAHLPAGVSHGLIKVETFEGIYGRPRHEGPYPRILCGDFNSPQEETVDGTTIPFGTNDERWSGAELSVITGLGNHDLKDVFRLLNGLEKTDKSWVFKNRGREYGRRFDHVFASQRLNVASCNYLHALRERGLSDHAPVEARFEPG